MVLGLLLVGAAVYFGAKAFSNSRDRQLRALQKRARKDACRAHCKGDTAAYSYYTQLARGLAIQRLQEAEQLARLVAQEAQARGRTSKAQRALAKAEGLRRRLQTQFGVSVPAEQTVIQGPLPLPPYTPYQPGMQLPAPAPMAVAAMPPVQLGAPTYALAPPSSAASPSPSVIYFQEQPSASFLYPAVHPSSYSPVSVTARYSQSSSVHSDLGEPLLTPVKTVS